MTKLNLNHLEILVKLAIKEEPTPSSEFDSYLNSLFDLIDAGLIRNIEGFYQFTEKGKKYFRNVLKNASDYLGKEINFN